MTWRISWRRVREWGSEVEGLPLEEPGAGSVLGSVVWSVGLISVLRDPPRVPGVFSVAVSCDIHLPLVSLATPFFIAPLTGRSPGKIVHSPIHKVISLIHLTIVLPISPIRIVMVGTASSDQKTKNDLPKLLVG